MTTRRPLLAPAALPPAPEADDRHLDLDDSEPEGDAPEARGGGYETAPCTIMLATNCCICGKALRDADSLAAGMGPDCRENVGYDGSGPEGQTDAAAVARLTSAGGEQVRRAGELAAAGDLRAAANLLIHWVGRDRRGPDAGRAIAALWALGYHRAATRLAECVGVLVTEGAEGLTVIAPFREGFGQVLRRHDAFARGEKVTREGEKRPTFVWRVDPARKANLWRALVDAYDGCALLSPRGVALIGKVAPRPEAPAAPAPPPAPASGPVPVRDPEAGRYAVIAGRSSAPRRGRLVTAR